MEIIVKYCKLLTVLPVLCCCVAIAAAQQPGADTARQPAAPPEVQPLLHPWLQTDNAAGLGMSALPATGSTSFTGKAISGGFHRPQQAVSSNSLTFQSQNYQRLKAASLYGNFSYTQSSDKQVQWSDVLNPYRGTPYLLADSVGGNWKKQVYAMNVRAASGVLGNSRIRVGVGADYTVSTGARQNDPRPLSTANELAVKPGMIWQAGRNSFIGVNGLYGSYKESVNLMIKNTNQAQTIYKLTGLGQYDIPAATNVGASRNYYGNAYGGALQYHRQWRRWQWLTEASYRQYTERVTEGTVPRTMAGYQESRFAAGTALQRTTDSYIQQWRLEGQRTGKTGTEHVWTSTAGVVKETLVADFYSSHAYRGGVSYLLIRRRNAQAYGWLVKAGVYYNDTENEYLYPYSVQSYRSLQPELSAAKVWSAGKGEWSAGLQLSYYSCLSQTLAYQLMTTTSNIVARKVLYPDQDYLTANNWQAACLLRYSFPLPAPQPLRFFVSGGASLQQRAGNTTVAGGYGGQRSDYTLGVGILY